MRKQLSSSLFCKYVLIDESVACNLYSKNKYIYVCTVYKYASIMCIYLENISKLPAKTWHLPPASTRIRSLATAVADLQHALQGVQGGDQE